MDALRIRGKDTFDYDKWDEVLVKKALTFDDIHKVVTNGISGENSGVDLETAKYVINDLTINGLEKGRLLKEVKAYTLRVLSPSLAMLEAQKSIQEVIVKNRNQIGDNITYDFLQRLSAEIPERTKYILDTERTLIAAIIYEIISSEI